MVFSSNDCGCVVNNQTVLTVFLVFYTWSHLRREWMGKVERMRPRTADGQEGWKEGGDDRGSSRGSWVDGGNGRAPSPGSMNQYNKTAPRDYQVMREDEHARAF